MHSTPDLKGEEGRNKGRREQRDIGMKGVERKREGHRENVGEEREMARKRVNQIIEGEG